MKKLNKQFTKENGYSDEMIEFYNFKIPLHRTSQFFEDSFDEKNIKLIKNFVNRSFDLTRYDVHNWYELLFEYDAFEFEDKEITKKLIDETLLNTDSFSEHDKQAFAEFKTIYFSLKTSQFHYN